MKNRTAELAKIHIGAKQMGLDPSDKDPGSEYRSMLFNVVGVHSSANLSAQQRHDVIKHMENCGVSFRPKNRPKPAQDRKALVSKIRAQLMNFKRSDSYADGMAKKMFKVERFEWCTPEQLVKIVAALNYDAKRKNKK